MGDETLPRVWLSFEIYGSGSFDPAEVTAKLGIEPTDHHRAGEATHAAGGVHNHDRWRITLGPSETLEIETMLTELLEMLHRCQEELVAVYRELDVEARLVCAVEPTSALTPAISFPADVVRWAAEHHVELDVDITLRPVT